MTITGHRDGTLQLPDGRQLGFAEWGAEASDTVVFDFHGGPGCRLSLSGDAEVVASSDVRWVTVDRPGLGTSWPAPGRTVAGFSRDVSALADHLRVPRFHALGWSMGGAYASACAALLPDRVISATLFAPVPVDVSASDGAERMGKATYWVLARDNPWQMCELYTALGLEARRDPDLALRLFSDGLSATESAVLHNRNVAESFITMMVEATRQGAVGLVDDQRVELAPWGFDPADIRIPISLWQGDDDSFVSMNDARRWAATVPGLDLKLLPGEGHLFPFTQTVEFLTSLS